MDLTPGSTLTTVLVIIAMAMVLALLIKQWRDLRRRK